jgi:hypothetical protein
MQMCIRGHNLEQNKYTGHVKRTLMHEDEEMGLIQANAVG